MIGTMTASLESTIDAFKTMLLGPEFARALTEAHSQELQPVKWGMRKPEVVYVDETDNHDRYPCVELIAIREDDNQDSAIAHLTCEIACQFTVNGDDPEDMSRELKRLIAATRATFRNCPSSAGVPGKFRTGVADYSPTTAIANQSKPYAKSASIEIFWNVFLR